MSLPLSLYDPGRFDYMMQTRFARKAWEMIANKEAIEQMKAATHENKAAIVPLLPHIETAFARELTSGEFAGDDAQVMINNMIKQVMEMHGYEHRACGLCPGADIFRSSGVYRKRADS